MTPRPSTPRGPRERLLKPAWATYRQLLDHPGIGEQQDFDTPGLAGLRCATVTRFKSWLIFYRPVPTGIEILHIRHAGTDVEALFNPEDAQGRAEP